MRKCLVINTVIICKQNSPFCLQFVTKSTFLLTIAFFELPKVTGGFSVDGAYRVFYQFFYQLKINKDFL